MVSDWPVRRSAAGVAGAALLACATAAEAGGFGGSDFEGLFGKEWTVGGVLFVSPKYEGSDEYEVVGAPFAFPGSPFDGTGLVTFAGLDAIQIRLLRPGNFELGPVIGYRFGRDEDDGDLLRGLGDIDGGFIAGVYGAVTLGAFKFTTSYHHQVGGDETGGVLRLRGAVEVPVSAATKLTFTAGTNYASEDYMDTYFGVSPAQSAASIAGLPVYDADAGFKDVFFSVNAAMKLDQRWGLMIGGSYSRLIGDAGDSPVIETEDQFTGTLVLTYTLN